MNGRKLSNSNESIQPPKKSIKRFHRRNSNKLKKEKDEDKFDVDVKYQIEDEIVIEEEEEELSLLTDFKIYTESIIFDEINHLEDSLNLIKLCSSISPILNKKNEFPNCCFNEKVNEETNDFGRKFQTIQAVGLGIKLKELMGL